MTTFLQYILIIGLTLIAAVSHASGRLPAKKVRMDHVEFRISEYLNEHGADPEDKSIQPINTPAEAQKMAPQRTAVVAPVKSKKVARVVVAKRNTLN
ncbi:hypothetical protein K1X76_06120 [bacterium]|nr:hypothetical protein [bacterium]